MPNKPIIGITLGDAAGVGPEVIAKALSEDRIYENCRPIVIGDSKAIREGVKVARKPLKLHPVKKVTEAYFRLGTIDILDLNNIDITKLEMGKPQAMAGKASVEYIKKAVELAKRGEIDAIATAPINKEAVNKAGFKYSGHTELLAELTGTKDYAMMLVGGPLRVIHVTTHVSLRQACKLVDSKRILKTIRLAWKAMGNLGIEKPKLAVAALNPHAGEGGLFGSEEIDIIKPAVELARDEGIEVSGPYPADTVFLRASRGEFDMVVAMYHDQGHIPIKMYAFEGGVNVTVGLPIIRTSVDHGTAYRRAGLKLGTGNPKSMIEAILLAADMAEKKNK